MTSHKPSSSANAAIVVMLIMLVGIVAEKAFLDNEIFYLLLLLTITAVFLTIKQDRDQHEDINTRAN